MEEKTGVATHVHAADVALWSLSTEHKHTKERLFSGGMGETVVLSISIVNPMPGPFTVEIMANGHSVPDGVLDKKRGITSRTWKLKNVKTIDLRARTKGYCSGRYAISVTL